MTELVPAAVGPYRLQEPLQTLPYASVHRAVRDGGDRSFLLWRFRQPYATAAGFVEALEQLAGDPRTRQVPGLVTVEEVGTVQEAEPLAFLVTGDAPWGFLVPALEARRAPGVFATATQLASTLDTAHALGLVHGDVQPSTVVLDADGRPALVGLAVRTVVVRVSSDADRAASAAAFRPPEGTLGSEADAAADRYGLAALVFYLLCGHSPAEDGEHVPPGRWRPGIPPRVDEVVMRALSRNPGERFPTATLFTAALTGSPFSVPVPPSPASAAAPGVAAPMTWDQPVAPPSVAAPPPAPPVPAVERPMPAAAAATSAGATEPSRDQERRGRSVWLAVGVALVVGVIAAAVAVIYLLGHGGAHAIR